MIHRMLPWLDRLLSNSARPLSRFTRTQIGRLSVSSFSATVLTLLSITGLGQAQSPTSTALGVTIQASTSGPSILKLVSTTTSTTNLIAGTTVFYADGKIVGSSQVVTSVSPGHLVGNSYLSLRLPIGKHSLIAKYLGTTQFIASTSSAYLYTESARLNSAALVTSAGSSTSLDLTATVSGFGALAPTGTVTITDQTSHLQLGNLAVPTSTPSFSLASPTSYPVGAAPSSMVVGDYNNDGFADVAVTNTGDGTLSILLGNPDGTFQPQMTYPAGPGCMGLVSGDVNNDGILDLIVVDQAVGSVGLQLGNGDGSFQPQTILPNILISGIMAQDRPTVVLVGDWNHDGKLDLALMTDQQTLITAVGNGDGTFQTPVSYTIATPASLYFLPGTTTISAIASGDFNNDGFSDLILLNSDLSSPSSMLGNWLLYTNQGDGTFLLSNAGTTSGGSMAAILTGDFNADGNLDAAFSSNSIYLATNSGDYIDPLDIHFGSGNGTLKIPSAGFGTNGTVSSIVAADLNGDGNPDIAVNIANPSQGNFAVAVYLGTGGGNFATAPTVANVVSYRTGVGTKPVQLASADLTGNGLQDILALNIQAADSSGIGSVTTLRSQVQQSVLLPNQYILGAGTQSLAASYSGDLSYLPATSLPLLVQGNTPAATATTLTASQSTINLGGSESFVAKVTVPANTPIATGTVTFNSDSTVLGTAVLNAQGSATFTTTYSSAGSKQVTATYGGSSIAAPSTSPAITINVLTPMIALSASPAVLTVAAGSSAGTQLTVTPAGGFQGPVQFSCSGLPSYTTCSFQPSTISVTNGPVSTLVTFATNVSTGVASVPHNDSLSMKIAFCSAGFGGLVLFSAKRRSRSAKTLLVALLSVGFCESLILGCSGGQSTSTSVAITPAGTSSVTISAVASTSISVATSMTIPLTITK
jgi:hypothetical protein